jgi:hypothetical protein
MTISTLSVSTKSIAANSIRFNSRIAETKKRVVETSAQPSRKPHARSPYREKTRMLRVPESLYVEFRARLDAHKRTVALGAHDCWE